MAESQLPRVWLGDAARQTGIHTQLTNFILNTISPAHIGNHNKKLVQLLQNVIVQFLGEVENCITTHGHVDFDTMRMTFSNSIVMLFKPSDGVLPLPGDFDRIVESYVATQPNIPHKFIIDSIGAFAWDLNKFIKAWCVSYDKLKPDAHAIEIMLRYTFCNMGTDDMIIKNLIIPRITTAHNISKIARNKKS